MCTLQVDLLSVTFDPETAEILLLIVTPTFGGYYVASIRVAISFVTATLHRPNSIIITRYPS